MMLNLTLNLLIILKLLMAALIGVIIGRERKRNEKPGVGRTFALISIGPALTAIISLELFGITDVNEVITRYDFARLMSYGIASIGFLGSGMIIKNKNTVEGLTSASTMWAIVAVVFCVVLGYFEISITSTIIIYLILSSKYGFFKGEFIKKVKRKCIK